MSTPFEEATNKLLWGCSTKAQSKKLQNIANQITKVPESINIPMEYITAFPKSDIKTGVK